MKEVALFPPTIHRHPGNHHSIVHPAASSWILHRWPAHPPLPVAKRMTDILVASLLLVALSPLLLLIAVAVVLESPGPVFYVAPRMGYNCQVFNFYKFRTMRGDANQTRASLQTANLYAEVFFKLHGDPRVTRVGRWLRRTSLDELPQLFNVLRGDMSLVGNRPLPLDEATILLDRGYIERFCAPAGLTGLWQVTPDKDRLPVAHRIALDLRYAREHSLLLDLQILLDTLPAILQRE